MRRCARPSLAPKPRIQRAAKRRSGAYVYSNCGNTRPPLHILSIPAESLQLALHLSATPARIITIPPVSRAGYPLGTNQPDWALAQWAIVSHLAAVVHTP